MRGWLEIVEAPFWLVVSLWALADRAAHGRAGEGLALGGALLVAGMLISWLVKRAGRHEASERAPARRTTGERAERMARALVGATLAFAAIVVLAPVEVLARAAPGDSWVLVAGRCLLHGVFAFAAAWTAIPTGRRAPESARQETMP